MWDAICAPEKVGVGALYAEIPEFSKNRDAVKAHVIKIARIHLEESFDLRTGGTEYGITDGKSRNRNRIWWVQAETMVGFFNAWQITGEEKYIKAVYLQWNWIKKSQIDSKCGDWFWSVDASGYPDFSHPKGGNWKTPYHTARMCLELIGRIENHGN
jgi:mannobiose 2-epimerase